MAAAIIGLVLGLGHRCRMPVLRYSIASTPAPDWGVPLARDDGGLRYCRPYTAARENPGATGCSMKSMIGIVLAFALGFRVPGIWNSIAGTTANPWRVARDDDDDWLHRGRSVGGLAGSACSGLRRTERAVRVSGTFKRCGALSDDSAPIHRVRRVGVTENSVRSAYTQQGQCPSRSWHWLLLPLLLRSVLARCCPEPGCLVVSFGTTVFKCPIR